MRITDCFDKALYINLDYRVRRRERVEAEFNKHSLVVQRVAAIQGNPGIETDVIDGQVGCALSHIKCINMAIKKKWKTLLVLEDDVEFKEDATNLFMDYFSRVPKNWDMIYLGGNHYGYDLTGIDRTKFPSLTYVAENVYKTTHTLTTHAYAIKHTMYRKVVTALSLMNKEVDISIAKLHPQNNVYVFRPNIAWQRSGFSDINNTACNYDFMKDEWM